MNNEPVAWMVEGYDGIGSFVRTVVSSKPKPDSWVNVIPLYTHPAKTLTDEEIEDFTVRIYNCRTGAEAHEIVLAILRKAQEK